jgi:hypothetical protein
VHPLVHAPLLHANPLQVLLLEQEATQLPFTHDSSAPQLLAVQVETHEPVLVSQTSPDLQPDSAQPITQPPSAPQNPVAPHEPAVHAADTVQVPLVHTSPWTQSEDVTHAPGLVAAMHCPPRQSCPFRHCASKTHAGVPPSTTGSAHTPDWHTRPSRHCELEVQPPVTVTSDTQTPPTQSSCAGQSESMTHWGGADDTQVPFWQIRPVAHCASWVQPWALLDVQVPLSQTSLGGHWASEPHVLVPLTHTPSEQTRPSRQPPPSGSLEQPANWHEPLVQTRGDEHWEFEVQPVGTHWSPWQTSATEQLPPHGATVAGAQVPFEQVSPAAQSSAVWHEDVVAVQVPPMQTSPEGQPMSATHVALGLATHAPEVHTRPAEHCTSLVQPVAEAWHRPPTQKSGEGHRLSSVHT